jgi:1-acyl-sn-glycerol-3-phosphate acyltransferase
MKALFRIEHRGTKHIPGEGALIFVSNHVTYLDPFWLGIRIYRTLYYMAMAPLFRYSWIDSILRWLGAFPVNLESPESSTIKTALSILKRGESLLIFPEGGRSKDGRLTSFKEGAANLALKTGATLLPVAILGGNRVWSPAMALPRFRKVRIHYLAPIRKEDFHHLTPAELTLKIQEAIKTELHHPP